MAKKKKISVDFDLWTLDEVKNTCNRQLLDAREQQKYKRTSKSKRLNKGVINFFSSLAYYLNNLSQNETDDHTN